MLGATPREFVSRILRHADLRRRAWITFARFAVGLAIADTDHARACLRESCELSTALGYQSALDLVWAASIAFLTGDQAAALELGRRAIRGLQCGGGLRMGFVLYIIAGTLISTRPDAAVVIQGAAEAYIAAPVGNSSRSARP